jgi:hypothetical protein
VRLHPDRFDHRVRPPAVGHLLDYKGHVFVVVIIPGVHHLDSEPARQLDSLGHEVDGDDPVTSLLRDARAHLSYRP